MRIDSDGKILYGLEGYTIMKTRVKNKEVRKVRAKLLDKSVQRSKAALSTLINEKVRMYLDLVFPTNAAVTRAIFPRLNCSIERIPPNALNVVLDKQ